MNTVASTRTTFGRVLLLVGIVVLAVCLVLLTLATPPQRHATFRLAIGPQMAISQGLGGSAAQGGPRAYMEALEAIAGVRLELRRSPSIESAIALLRAGAVDGVAFSLPSTRSLLPASAVISAPFYTGTSVLVSRRTAAHTSLASLAGRRVAVIDNGEYRTYLAQAFPDIEVLPLASPADMLAALDSGAADAALGADGILVPLTRRDHDAILQVHAAPDGPAVELRVASVPSRAVEVSMAHQALLALPSDIHKDILERTLNAVYRAPPTLRAVATYYRTPIILFCLVMLAILLSISRAYRKARRTAARQAAAARVLTLVNHEVRNSASAVISAIDLAEGEPTSSQREQHFASARSAADALRHTLTNALEFMLHEASQRSCEASSHSAQAVLEECISGMRPLALSKGLGLRLALDASDAALTHCDARALHHIASNLISNAIKFSDAGTVVVRLGFLRGVGELGRVSVRVSDCGPGIAMEDIERIFEPFNGTAQGRRRLGAGIGLSLCRRIAISQGGDITVATQVGIGSTFLATLRGRQEAPPLASGAPALCADAATAPRALVVEDQPAIAEMIKRRLEAQRFQVTVAHTGAEAITRVDVGGPFALITLDGDLMDRDGSDVAIAIRAIEARRSWPASRLISLSGSGESRDRSAYARAQVHVFLTKPVEWAVFDAAVRPAQRTTEAPLPRNTEHSQSVMAIYATQMQVDIADLEAVIGEQNWRRALAMAHRIQGAASMVGDTAAVAAICALQTCLKVHAINGDPAEQDLWELVSLLAQLRDATGSGQSAVPPG
ncbi:amino acid-binding domain sensor hybrid histidine kinase [Stenotrophomonas rhizophila]|uniref:ATP-binding protein n=1 Tax=Stenotrophomonas rhizophila TaxID=216778 RepID=UPI000FBD2CE7|nr:ATP-binding protein [Stenotrophomonas rhizophila]ROP80329.1 amino acid-binding domain sensor hybrid histidine kinase [Stenotrophomonas rhizophila]